MTNRVYFRTNSTKTLKGIVVFCRCFRFSFGLFVSKMFKPFCVNGIFVRLHSEVLNVYYICLKTGKETDNH